MRKVRKVKRKMRRKMKKDLATERERNEVSLVNIDGLKLI